MKLKDSGQRRLYRLLSFLIPFAVVLFCFTLLGRYPLGSAGAPLLGDASGEYYPHMILLRRILKNGESLAYTWRAGLGVDVYTDVFCNFCTSVFTLLGYLLPDSMYLHYISLTICIRIGLAGYFLAVLFQGIAKKADAAVPVFCTAYAMNMWFMTSFWQITMLDAVIITPLVLLGIVKMVRDKDMRMYPLILAFSLLSSYYMTIFTAILTGFFWIGTLIVYRKPWREVPKETFRFLFYSVMAACIAAVIMVPAVVGMQSSALFEDTAFHWTEFYLDFKTQIAQLATAVKPIVNEYPANTASSMVVVLCALGYLTAPRIQARERIYTALFAVFVFMSLWYSPLNLIWHGLHYPYVTVDRFSYILPMVLAFMGWRYTVNLHPELPPEGEDTAAKKTGRVFYFLFQAVLMAGAVLGVCWCAYEKKSTDVILVPLCFGGGMLLLYIFYRFCKKRSFVFYLMLTAAVTGEAMLCGWLGYSERINSFSNQLQTIAEDETAVKSFAACAADNDQPIYRSGLCGMGPNDELHYDDVIGGTSTFSSTVPYDLKRLAVLLGMQPGDPNAKYYQIDKLPPLSTLLLDVQYVVSAEAGFPGSCLYEPLNGNAEDAHAFKFAYPCYPGFCIPGNVSPDELPERDLAGVQNTLAQHLTGISEPLMPASDVKWTMNDALLKDAEAELNGNDLHMKADGELPDPDADPTEIAEVLHPCVSVRTTAPADGCYWLELSHDDEIVGCTKRIRIEVDGEPVYEQNAISTMLRVAAPSYFPLALGNLSKGTEIQISYYLLNGTEGDVTLHLSRVDNDVFAKIHEKLTASPLTVTDFRQSEFTGTVEAQNDSLLYVAMPYRKGWTAYVDGTATTISPAFGAMTAIPISAGQHVVRFEYKTPGLLVGAAISGGGLLLWLIFAVIVSIKLHHSRKMERMLEEALHRETPPAAPAAEQPKPAQKSEKKPAQKPAEEQKAATRTFDASAASPAKPAADPNAATRHFDAPAKPAATAAPAKPAAPAQPAKPARPSEGARKRPGLYENHRPQRLTAEDQAEARFVKGAHFAGGDDEDDNADD